VPERERLAGIAVPQTDDPDGLLARTELTAPVEMGLGGEMPRHRAVTSLDRRRGVRVDCKGTGEAAGG
jgi:hypothetical protein